MISPTRLRTTNLTPFLAGQAQCSSQNLRENCAHVTTKMRPLASLIRKIHITTINTTLQSAVRTSAGSCGHEVPPHFASIQSSSFRGMSTSKEPEDKDVSSSTHSSEDQVAQTSSPADTPGEHSHHGNQSTSNPHKFPRDLVSRQHQVCIHSLCSCCLTHGGKHTDTRGSYVQSVSSRCNTAFRFICCTTFSVWPVGIS